MGRRHFRAIAGCFAAIAFVAGCGGVFWPYSVKPYEDEFTGARGVAMRNNEVAGPAMESGRLFLDVRRLDDGAASRLILEVRYMAPDWMFIRPGESLVFLVDGERLPVSGEGSAGRREVEAAGGAVTVYEQATYAIDPSVLRRIGSASEVRMRISGQARNLERRLSQQNLERFAAFAAEHAR